MGSSKITLERSIEINDYKVCKTCKQLLSINEYHKDPKSKLVRGLLCRNCNLALGYLKDNIETINSSISYLNKHQENGNS
jgi:hypothetical protein